MDILPDILKQAGLNEAESVTYSSLLNIGPTTILELAKRAGLKRTNLYNVLKDLEAKNLVSKIIKNKTTTYYPNSPNVIKTLFEQRQVQLNSAKGTFELLEDDLKSKFNTFSLKPTVTYLTGIKGLQQMYDDILDTMKNILVIRSTYDDDREDVDRLIQKQVISQAKRGIHARVIGPFDDPQEIKQLYTKLNKIHLVEERYISKFPFNLEAQVIMYGNKVAITTIRKEIVITLIDNKQICDTFRTMFDFIWTYAAPEHNEIVSNWKPNGNSRLDKP